MIGIQLLLYIVLAVVRQPTDSGEGEPETELSDFPGSKFSWFNLFNHNIISFYSLVLEFFETDYKEDTDSSTSGGISQPREWEVSW